MKFCAVLVFVGAAIAFAEEIDNAEIIEDGLELEQRKGVLETKFDVFDRAESTFLFTRTFTLIQTAEAVATTVRTCTLEASAPLPPCVARARPRLSAVDQVDSWYDESPGARSFGFLEASFDFVPFTYSGRRIFDVFPPFGFLTAVTRTSIETVFTATVSHPSNTVTLAIAGCLPQDLPALRPCLTPPTSSVATTPTSSVATTPTSSVATTPTSSVATTPTSSVATTPTPSVATTSASTITSLTSLASTTPSTISSVPSSSSAAVLTVTSTVTSLVTSIPPPSTITSTSPPTSLTVTTTETVTTTLVSSMGATTIPTSTTATTTTSTPPTITTTATTTPTTTTTNPSTAAITGSTTTPATTTPATSTTKVPVAARTDIPKVIPTHVISSST